MTTHLIPKIVGGVVGTLIILVVGLNSCSQINSGEVGVKRVLGKVQSDVLQPGLAFYTPFVTSVYRIPVREQQFETTTEAYTKDTQTAGITFTILYSVKNESAATLFVELGADWADKLIKPMVVSNLKDVVGQFTADELISKREEVRRKIQAHVTEKLAQRGVIVTQVEFTNIDFDDAFEAAVRAKVVAVQKAAEARNKTVEVEEQAKQKVISAEAEAKSIEIQSKALENNQGIVGLRFIEKWDGKLPQVMGSSNIMQMIKEVK